MNTANQNKRGLINQDVLGLAVTMVEDGRSFDEFEDKFQEHYASQTTLPAITFYTLANWVVNTYKPVILKDMVKRTGETCEEENKEERPKIQQISVRHRYDVPGGPYTDDIIGADLALHIHDGYVDITDTTGRRYLCHEEDTSSIICFPSKKEEKDG